MKISGRTIPTWRRPLCPLACHPLQFKNDTDVHLVAHTLLTATGQDAIEYAYGRCEGTCSPPDLCAAFAKLDKASTGFLDRARFALALRGVRPSLELSPELLRVAMDSFDDAIAGERDGAGEEGASSRTDYRSVMRVKDRGVAACSRSAGASTRHQQREKDREKYERNTRDSDAEVQTKRGKQHRQRKA